MKAPEGLAPILISLLSGSGKANRQMAIEIILESIGSKEEIGETFGGKIKTNNKTASLVIRFRNEDFSYRTIRKQAGLAL